MSRCVSRGVRNDSPLLSPGSRALRSGGLHCNMPPQNTLKFTSVIKILCCLVSGYKQTRVASPHLRAGVTPAAHHPPGCFNHLLPLLRLSFLPFSSFTFFIHSFFLLFRIFLRLTFPLSIYFLISFLSSLFSPPPSHVLLPLLPSFLHSILSSFILFIAFFYLLHFPLLPPAVISLLPFLFLILPSILSFFLIND